MTKPLRAALFNDTNPEGHYGRDIIMVRFLQDTELAHQKTFASIVTLACRWDVSKGQL